MPASRSRWDFCSCSALPPPLLLSHLSRKQRKSRRGCVFTARQLLQHQGWVQGSCWKTCYIHTYTHTYALTPASGWWKTSTVPKPFVYSCLGCLDTYAIDEGDHPPSQHSTHSWIGPHISLETSQAFSPACEMLGHVTGDVLPVFWQGPSVLSLYWKRFGKELEEGRTKSKPLSWDSTVTSLWKWHLLNTRTRFGPAVNKGSRPPCCSVTTRSF